MILREKNYDKVEKAFAWHISCFTISSDQIDVYVDMTMNAHEGKWAQKF